MGYLGINWGVVYLELAPTKINFLIQFDFFLTFDHLTLSFFSFIIN